jgi:hypothetical protein
LIAHVALLEDIAQVISQQLIDVLRGRHSALVSELYDRLTRVLMDTDGQHGTACQLWWQAVGVWAGIATKKVKRQHCDLSFGSVMQ